MRRPGRSLRRAAAAALWLPLAAGCGRGEGGGGGRGGGGKPVFPVEVVPVAARSVEYVVTSVGSVEAFEIVQVTARVPGAIERVHFAEGDVVRESDVLAEIEPGRYRLEVATAQASLEKAVAAVAEAAAGLERREGVVERNPGLIPAEELQAWRTRLRTARAESTSAHVALQRAEMNLGDALARAPVSGTIESRDVQTGQYVQPGTLLTTLVRRDPLLLRFNVHEQDAPRMKQGMTVRFTVRESERALSARITHAAESADPATRMVAVTAEVTDPERGRLWPGSFAEVTVPVGGAVAAPVIPQTAIRPSERGFLAYVVAEGTARERVLTLGLRTPEGEVEVREGLALGESLVVRGAEALSDGAAVRVSGAVR